MPPPLPPAQQITFLYAEDPLACRRFYAGVLGLRLVLEQAPPQGVGCAIFAVAGGSAFLGICQASGPREALDPRRQGGVVLTLVTDAVEAWHAHLVAAGVTPEAPPAHRGGIGITHFFFRDPAGYLLEIQRFESPAWPPRQPAAQAATNAAQPIG
jgi:catechol 2,3-dioxygenase-like lactoylglutathione lyase family enzyme